MEDRGLADLVSVANVLGLSPNALATAAGIWHGNPERTDDQRWQWLQNRVAQARPELRERFLAAAYAMALGLEQLEGRGRRH